MCRTHSIVASLLPIFFMAMSWVAISSKRGASFTLGIPDLSIYHTAAAVAAVYCRVRRGWGISPGSSLHSCMCGHQRFRLWHFLGGFTACVSLQASRFSRYLLPGEEDLRCSTTVVPVLRPHCAKGCQGVVRVFYWVHSTDDCRTQLEFFHVFRPVSLAVWAGAIGLFCEALSRV